MSLKEKLQELGLLNIAVRCVSGELKPEEFGGHSLVEVIWGVVKLQKLNNQLFNLEPPRSDWVIGAKVGVPELELEIFYKHKPPVN